MLPIGLAILALTGIGPLLAWRKSTLSNLRYQFLGPVATGLATGALVYGLGFRVWSSGLCFALCAFVGATIVQEFVRGARVRRRSTGTDFLTALIGLVARSRRRYGGYIVHLGIVLMFLGFAGEGYKLDEQVLLQPGQQAAVGRFTVRYDALRVTDDGQKQMITGHVTAFKDGRPIGELRPAKWFFRKHEDQPTTEVAINRSLSEDLYLVLAGYDLQTQSATFQIVVNPLVNWIWFGFGVLVVGTGIALMPESALAFAAAKVPAGAATAGAVLLAIVAGGGVAAAQHVESAATVPVAPRSALEKELRRSIICMCGTCGRQLVAECTCGYAAQMREEIAALVRQGLTKDEVLAYYVRKYGSQEPLAAPIDRGFNRLAWLLPYALGGAGAVLVGAVAASWARRVRRAGPEAAGPAETDAALEARLDEELRDLD